jgi:predicted enzyme related to lactoylglutathione lyase
MESPGSEETTMGRPVTHFEILGSDAGALRQFYAQAFGWKLGSPGGDAMEYAMVETDGGAGIGGGIGRAPQGPGQVTFYVSVDDPSAALAEIERLGGRTVLPPQEVPGGVTFALFADPEGHVVGLFKE